MNFRKKSNLQCVDGLRISTVSKWLSFEFDIVKLLMNYNFFTISDQFIRKLWQCLLEIIYLCHVQRILHTYIHACDCVRSYYGQVHPSCIIRFSVTSSYHWTSESNFMWISASWILSYLFEYVRVFENIRTGWCKTVQLNQVVKLNLTVIETCVWDMESCYIFVHPNKRMWCYDFFLSEFMYSFLVITVITVSSLTHYSASFTRTCLQIGEDWSDLKKSN